MATTETVRHFIVWLLERTGIQLFVFLYLYMNTSRYQILTVKELECILHTEGRSILDSDEQLRGSYAHVFFLRSGKTIVVSSHRMDTSKGILFDDQSGFQSCYDGNCFPISNEEETAEEIFQFDLRNINLSIYEIKKKYFEKYKLEDNITSIEKVLFHSKGKGKKKPLKERYELGLLLGEYIRLKNNGNWGAMKQYGTFNPYYTPLIVYNNGSFLTLRDCAELFFRNKSYTSEWIAQLPHVKNPSGRIENMQASVFGPNEIQLQSSL